MHLGRTFFFFFPLATKVSVLISSGSACSVGHRRTLSCMNIPQTPGRAVHGLPLLHIEADEELLKRGGCFC